jgi:hypothetical protein
MHSGKFLPIPDSMVDMLQEENESWSITRRCSSFDLEIGLDIMG